MSKFDSMRDTLIDSLGEVSRAKEACVAVANGYFLKAGWEWSDEGRAAVMRFESAQAKFAKTMRQHLQEAIREEKKSATQN